MIVSLFHLLGFKYSPCARLAPVVMFFIWLLLLLPRFDASYPRSFDCETEEALRFAQECFTKEYSIFESTYHVEALEFARECFVPDTTIKLKVDLNALRHEANSALVSIYTKIFVNCSSIKWKKVKVLGWPQDVLFYSSANWSAEDCESVLKAVHRGQIKFEARNKSFASFVPKKQREALRDKAGRLSKLLFKSNQIEWKKFKQHCPELHLTRNSLDEWSAEDCANLEAALASLEKNFPKSLEKIHEPEILSELVASETEQASQISRDEHEPQGTIDTNLSVSEAAPIHDSLSALQDQVYDELLAKYRELFPNDLFINWLDVKAQGWPDDVIFYSKNCWSEADCLSLQEALPKIHFVSSIVTQFLSWNMKMNLKRRVSDFFMTYFNTDKIDWLLVRMAMPGFHLSCADFSLWNMKDANKIEEVFVYFRRNFSKRKAIFKLDEDNSGAKSSKKSEDDK